MKKFIAITTALILSISCFTSCGDEDDDDYNSSSSKISKSELDQSASSISKAFTSTFAEKGGEIKEDGIIASDGTCTISENPSIITDTAVNYFMDLNKYKWICVEEDCLAKEIYIAESWNDTVIGTYPETLDTNGKKLSEIKEEIQTRNSNISEPTTVQVNINSVETTTVNEPTTLKPSSSNTFGFTVTEFVDYFNDNAPTVFTDYNMRLSYDNYEYKGANNKSYTYKFFKDNITMLISADDNDYINIITLGCSVSLSAFDDVKAAANLAIIMLSPYIVFNKGSTFDDVRVFFSKMDSSSNSSTWNYSGSDFKARYTMTSGSSFGTLVNIVPAA